MKDRCLQGKYESLTVDNSIDGLIKCAEQVLPDTPENAPIIEGLYMRKRYQEIRAEFQKRRKCGEKAGDIIEDLAGKWYYSVKNIERLLYKK